MENSDKIVSFEDLKNRKITSLEKRIKDGRINNFKILSIRNLKISDSFINTFYPFLVSGMILIVTPLLTGRHMFYLDKIKIYQKYIKTIDSNSKKISIQTSYENITKDSTYIDVYSNWKFNKESNMYERNIQRYIIHNSSFDEESIRTIIEKQGFNYDEYFKDSILITESSKEIDESEIGKDNNLYVRATIVGEDYNTFEYYQETREEDWDYTRTQLICLNIITLILLLYKIKTSNNDSNLIREFQNKIKQIIDSSNEKVIDIERLEKELALIKAKNK